MECIMSLGPKLVDKEDSFLQFSVKSHYNTKALLVFFYKNNSGFHQVLIGANSFVIDWLFVARVLIFHYKVPLSML